LKYSELEVTIHPPTGSKKGSAIAPADDIRPLATFAQSGLPADMLKCTATFAKPTAIQSQCWPAILQGRDVIGIAETGSGKTLGFLLPALIHILDQPKIGNGDRAGPIMLTLSPTRELAMQTAAVAESSGLPVGIKSTCIYGGVDKNMQKKALKQGVHIVIATPGRLLGLIEEKALTLNRVTYLVLDEADRMLDLGFEPDIRAIVGMIGTERQTLLFSATWPKEIQALGREFVSNPFHVTIGNAGGEQLAANHRVKQVIEVIDEWKRDARILDLLKQYHSSRKNRVLIFVLYKKEVDRVERWLAKNGWAASGISGDKGQHDRTAALAAFKDGSKPLLIATDVAARGMIVLLYYYTTPLYFFPYVAWASYYCI
jgi:ATP-dependent RNA helicase DBP3